jgi:ankyrin repeat protein
VTGEAALFDALRAGDAEVVRTLLAQQPGLAGGRTPQGHSAVLIAQYHRRPELVALLLAAGPVLDVWDAAAVGRSERVAALLEGDPSLVNAYSADGFFPLGLAAFFGHLDTARLLLARGADVRQAARNPMRVQALHAAAAGRHLEIVRLVLDAGAPVNERQQAGTTPLHQAVQARDEVMVRVLLEHGADPRAQNDAGQSPIGLAAEHESPDLLRLLKGR